MDCFIRQQFHGLRSRFTLPVSADRVVFPTLYPGGSRRTGSGKPFPLVDLAADFIAGDLSDGDHRSA